MPAKKKAHWDYYWLLGRLRALDGLQPPSPPVDPALMELLNAEFPSRGHALGAIVDLEKERGVPA